MVFRLTVGLGEICRIQVKRSRKTGQGRALTQSEPKRSLKRTVDVLVDRREGGLLSLCEGSAVGLTWQGLPSDHAQQRGDG